MLRWFDVDDGFFYFKVAQNFNRGLGFTFDGFNRANGFHPLWMAVCVVLYRLFPHDLIQPLRVIILVSGVMNGISAILIFKILSRNLGELPSFVMAASWATWPAIFKVTTTQGMETGLSVLLLLLLIERAQAWYTDGAKIGALKAILFGFIALIAILARLDHVFYVGMVCLFAVFRLQFRRGLLVVDVFGISTSVVLSYLITYDFGAVNYSDHTIFPLLFLSLVITIMIMQLAGVYREQGSQPLPRRLKILVWIVIANLALVPVLYLINGLDIFMRFSKLVIILHVTLSSAVILLNHFLHGLHAGASPAPEERFHWFEKEKLLNAVYTALPVAVGVGAYLAFNLRYFSTLLPVSGRIKHFWSTLENPVYGMARNFLDVFGIGRRINPWYSETSAIQKITDLILERAGVYSEHNGQIAFSLSLVAVLVLLVFGLAKARAGVLRKMGAIFIPALFIGSLLRVGFYAMYGYIGIRNWYWIVERLILVLLVAVLLDLVWEKVKNFQPARVGYPVILIGLMVYSIGASAVFGYRTFYTFAKNAEEESLLTGVRTLERLTPEGSLVGMTGGGMEGYFISGRTVVNLDGLINSVEYYRSLLAGSTQELLDEWGIDYVYGNIYMLTKSDPYRMMLEGRLTLIHTEDEEIGLYEYR